MNRDNPERLEAVMTPARSTVLEIRGLEARYGERQVLRGIDLNVARDDFVAIIGPSGSGKSTLIRCINRLVEPSGGKILFDGVDLLPLAPPALRRARRDIGMIFQEFNLVERMTVLDNVVMGRLGDTGTLRSLTRLWRNDVVEEALALIERVGLAEHARQRADRLSGGQRQRVGIARALMQRPKLLLVDEPTSSLDPRIARDVMTLIREVACERHIPVLCNIHDIDLALAFCTRMVGLQHGRARFEGQPGSIDRASVQHIYEAEVL